MNVCAVNTGILVVLSPEVMRGAFQSQAFLFAHAQDADRIDGVRPV
jgi:hypothetical protein